LKATPGVDLNLAYGMIGEKGKGIVLKKNNNIENNVEKARVGHE